MVYSTDQGYQPKPLYEFLAIEKEPPLEMAEIKVFSNFIPLVFLLGYYKGVIWITKENLMYVLVKYSEDNDPNLSSTEYAIKFAERFGYSIDVILKQLLFYLVSIIINVISKIIQSISLIIKIRLLLF